MLTKLVMKFLAARQPVRIATTTAEREAVFRLRYAVYVEEQRDPELYVSHSNERIHTPEDDAENATIFYVGDPEAPDATGRVTLHRPGELPDAFYESYSLSRFPDIRSRTVFEANFLIARKDRRGSTAVVSLLSGAAEHMIRTYGAEVLICDCVPGLLGTYRKLGMRTYGGRLVPWGGGLLVPLAGILADFEHFRQVGSPLYPILEKLHDALPERDIIPLLEPLDSTGREEELEQIAEEIDQAFQTTQSTFLDRLTKSARSRLTNAALLLDIDAGMDVIREDVSEREMFIILKGVMSVRREGHTIATLGPGDLFGEIAFFREDALRTATVQAFSDARLLVLRRSFLVQLRKEHPDDAFEVYEALAAVLAERVLARG